MAEDGYASVDYGAAETKPRILMMGSKRSGKSSIQRVVFHKMSPHETLFLESTRALDVKYVANNPLVQFQIWDFPGDFDLRGDNAVVIDGQHLSDQAIFANTGAIIYVLDAQDDPTGAPVERLHDIVTRASRVNPSIYFAVFVHKVDGDMFLSEDLKAECQREVQQRVMQELASASTDVQIGFFLTSVYDHSVFEAFSKVVQTLVPQMSTLENLMNTLIENCAVEKAFLFDVVSKLYLATDSNPVDAQSFELCSDMLDVVIDVSCIYGLKEDAEMLAFDRKSASVIRLTGGPYNGMVLYLREVNKFLALVCLMREDNFTKQGIVDFNINIFRNALNDLIQKEQTAAGRSRRRK